MTTLLTLQLAPGDFQQGFPVTLSIKAENASSQITGFLPPAPEVNQDYEDWQSNYRHLDRPLRPRLEANADQVRNLSTAEECHQAAQKAIASLNSWLRSASFIPVRDALSREFNKNDTVRLLLQTDQIQVQRLLWPSWEFLDPYPNVEMTISHPRYQISNSRIAPSGKTVNILAILGDSTNINTAEDRTLLEQLPNVNLRLLVEPKRQDVTDELWQEGWDILFFAGHSRTEGERGRIYLNSQDRLTIEQLKNALKKAINNGLQLALFNSCDGLGLARQLSDLNLPQLIVMREPVPDKVAQEFLKYFLDAYANGQPLYLAVQESRKRLEGLEDKFPCASWLPVVFENPATVAPSWEELQNGRKGDRLSNSRLSFLPPTVKRWMHPVFVSSLAIASLVVCVREVGLLEAWELKAYDQVMRSRSLVLDEGPDSRILVVTIDEEDLQYQDEKGMERKDSLADAALSELLTTFAPHKPYSIGLDIYRDFPVRSDQQQLVKQLQQSNFFAICKASEVTTDPTGVESPPDVPKERVGFADVVTDKDGFLRRYLWYSELDKSCPTRVAFSLLLALHYLDGKGIEARRTEDDHLQLKNLLLKRLEAETGGYQRLDTFGYQMLLNYRDRTIAEHVSLRQVLQGEFEASLVKDKIVIIGVTAPSKKDYFSTPYSLSQQADQKMFGVFVQAQMASQIISAVLDNRPLLGVWKVWVEVLWIFGWSVVGGAITWRINSGVLLIAISATATVILYGSCVILLIQGSWVPLIPSALALVGTSVTIIIYRAKKKNES